VEVVRKVARRRAARSVETGVKTGVRVLYDDPKSGRARDRIVNAAAGQGDLGGPACIVDFGTGTTFDALSARGE